MSFIRAMNMSIYKRSLIESLKDFLQSTITALRQLSSRTLDVEGICKLILFTAKRSSKVMNAILMIAFFVSATPLKAQEAWPTSSDWVGLIQADWSKSADPDDQSADYLDIVADDNGYDSYFFSTSSSIFVRLGVQGTVLDKKGKLKPFAWQAPIDMNNDNFADWNIVVGGISEALRIYYDNSNSNDPTNLNWEVDDPLAAGFVREVANPATAYPDMIYLEIQVPYTAFQGPGLSSIEITPGTPIAFYFSTSTSESINIKDATGGSATITEAFANAVIVGSGTASFGFVYDSLDPDAYSSGASYEIGSTVYLDGYGWPPNSSLNAYIKDPAGTQVWSGTLTTDASGELSNEASWTVGGSYTGGECTIWITHPTLAAEGDFSYDRFTVPTPPLVTPDVHIEISASIDSVREGNSVTYTTYLINSGLTNAYMTTLIDTLPAGLSYVTGSSSSLTSTDPVITGDLGSGYILTWTGAWTLLSGSDVALAFDVSLAAGYGDNLTHDDRFGVQGNNFDPSFSGAQAHIKFLPPALAGADIVIEADNSLDTTVVSTNVSYTITITNNGDTAGDVTEVQNILPTGFVYVSGTSTGLTTGNPTISGSTLTWTGNWSVGADGSGSSVKTLNFTATSASTPGDYDNQASVSGSNFSQELTGPTATVTVVEAPSAAYFVIEKTVSPTTVLSGDTVTYTIVVTNVGGVNENAIVYEDILPDGFTYIPGTTTGFSIADPSIDGQTLSWLGSWRVSKNGGTRTLSFDARVAFKNGTYPNEATVYGETIGSFTTGTTAVVEIQAPVLVLSKTVDIVNAAPGDTLTYTVTYTNTGTASASLITVLESIPVSTDYVDASASSTPAMDISFTTLNGVVTNIQFVQNNNLAPGNSGSLSFKVRIK